MYKNYDYKSEVDGKEYLIKLDFVEKQLYSWQSTSKHLAEGAGGSVSFQEFQVSKSWQNWILRSHGTEVLTTVLQKIAKAMK